MDFSGPYIGTPAVISRNLITFIRCYWTIWMDILSIFDPDIVFHIMVCDTLNKYA